MIFEETPLVNSFVVSPEPFKDERGAFARIFCQTEFENIHEDLNWVQINHSYSKHIGTLRGMHYQLHPYEEVKMVKCVSGKIHDVIVDLRPDSKSYLQWFAVELSEVNQKMIYIPKGFAHGFQCLSNNVELIYFHSEFYNPEYERGVKYNDPTFNIEWPLPVSNISERDLNHPNYRKS